MYRFIFILLFVLSFYSAFPQKDSKWNVEILYAREEPDTRNWNTWESENNPRAGIELMGWLIKYQGISANWINVRLGVGYALETHTYRKHYDHKYLYNSFYDDYRLFDTYNLDLLLTELEIDVPIIAGFAFSTSAQPQIVFQKHVHPNRGHNPKYLFELYRMEIMTGLGYQTGLFRFELSYRLAQWKPLDETLPPRGAFVRDNPGFLEQDYDRFNPNKWQLGVGLMF